MDGILPMKYIFAVLICLTGVEYLVICQKISQNVLVLISQLLVNTIHTVYILKMITTLMVFRLSRELQGRNCGPYKSQLFLLLR